MDLSDRTPAWREALPRCFDMLEGWRALVLESAEAAERVIEGLADGVAKAEVALRDAPDRPSRSSFAREMEEYRTLPPRVFASLAPILLDRMAEESPEIAPTVAALRLAMRRLGAAQLPDDALEEHVTEEVERAPDDVDSDDLVTEEVERGALGVTPPEGPMGALDLEDRAEAVRGLVLGRWEEALAIRILEWERERLADVFAELAIQMHRKQETAQRLKRLLGVELGYLGLSGTWGEGAWSERAWGHLEELVAMAERNPAVRQLAERLGRLEVARVLHDRQTVPRTVARRNRVMLRGGQEEVQGVHFSGEMARVTAGELVVLGDPELEILFYMKLLDRQLLTYETVGRQQRAIRDQETRVVPVRQPDRKGPILLCIDTSASMAGEPELVAKTLSLAMLRVALRERRPCWAISYSHTQDLRERELTRFPEALEELLEFLGMGFRGGTDPVPALQAAFRRLEDETFSRADILWVTDGVFKVPGSFEAYVRGVRAQKNVRIHTLLVGRAVVPDFVDTCWEWSEGLSFETGAIDLIYGLTEEPPPRASAEGE